MSRWLFTFFFLFVLTNIAYAIAPPPTKIVEQIVSPDCLKVEEASMCGQSPSYGTCGTGPAIKITNGCALDIEITSIVRKPDIAEAAAVSNGISGYIHENEEYEGWEFIYFSDPTRCAEANEKAKKYDADLHKQQAADKKALLDKKDPLAIWREKSRLKLERERAGEILKYVSPVACGHFSLSSGSMVSIGMPWENEYQIEGKSKKPAGGDVSEFAVNVRGKMTNPNVTNMHYEIQKLPAK